MLCSALGSAVATNSGTELRTVLLVVAVGVLEITAPAPKVPDPTVGILAATAAAPRQRITSRFILVSVTDSGGRTVFDVEPDDFVVREAGQPRDVLSIRVADYPIAIVLDNASGAGREFDDMRRATGRFIGRLGRRPIAIAAANPPRMVATLDDDRATLLQRVNTLRKGASADGLFQAVVTAAQTIGAAGAPFSAVVAVVSNPGGPVPAEVLAPVLTSGTHVHVLVHQKASGGRNPQRQQSLEMLADLVNDTRGQLMVIYSQDAYQLALDRLGNQLAAELMVEYLVPAGSSSGSDVQLAVRLSGVKVSQWGVSQR